MTEPRRGRRRTAESQARPGFSQAPFRPLPNSLPRVEPLSQDQLEAIHRSAIRVLAEVGVMVLEEEAVDLLKAQGAEVSGQRLRFPPGMEVALLEAMPAQFRLHARNPANDLAFGTGVPYFGTVASAPNSQCLDQGRRPGNSQDYLNFIRLAQVFNAIDLMGGYPVEPLDWHASTRHLDCIDAMLRLSDKPFVGYALGRERTLDLIEMARIGRGRSPEAFREEPSCMATINTNSPLQIDKAMAIGLIELARAGQAAIVTPFTLSGAMAPVSLAGALVQQHAEFLAAAMLSQAARKGAPLLYGGFTSNVDMKTGSPAFGTPEYLKAQQIGGQLARRVGVPYRSSNVNAANSVDAQAIWESQMSLWGALTGQADYIKHAAGWLEGGLSASFEKFVMDADMIQAFRAYMQPLTVDEAEMAVDAIAEVGPGGHFFGTSHTLARYSDAFFTPMTSDWRNFEAWSEAGGLTATQRANGIWKAALASHRSPALADDVSEALAEFVVRRKAEGGVAVDF